MTSLIDGVSTTYLGLDDYIADFTQVSDGLSGDIWKSERAQFFREPGNPSWEAFVAGRWQDAVARAERDLGELTKYFTELAVHGSRFYRVRAVELPLTDYLRWELDVLRVRAKAGEHIRVALPDVIEAGESHHGPIPELVILGGEAGYVVDYGADGAPRGAKKFVEAGALNRCRSALKAIYDRSVDLEIFFMQKVAPLGNPSGEA